ncbi:hypothetical protein BGZ54_002178, partial [Gamsiella multidivaricata]
SSTTGISISTRHHNNANSSTNNTQIKGSSRPSSPRTQHTHQPYSNQLRSVTHINTSATTTIAKPKYTASSPVTTMGSPTKSSTIPSYSSHTPMPASTTRHRHSLSASSTISYPHPAIHPPLRLLTTATCPDTYTCLVSAQSPPHSPTFSSLSLVKSSPSSSGSGSRASSILDGIQSALGVSPPSSSGTMKSSSTYSAAKESLADFSIAPSKRSTAGQQSNKRGNSTGGGVGGGVVRSRSNYVSFPNFDEVDFVDVTMVDDTDDDDETDWTGPDSPPEGQRAAMMETTSHGYDDMDEKLVRPALGGDVLDGLGGFGGRGAQLKDPRRSLGMPTSPSQHWLLQLETYHELRMNGAQV